MIEGLQNISWEEGISKIKDNSIQLVVTSPPYNLGGKDGGFIRNWKTGNVVKYESYQDNKKEDDYKSWIGECIQEVYRVLKSDGSFYLNLKPRYKDKQCLWPFWAVELGQEVGFALRDIIIWWFECGMDIGKSYWSRRYEIFIWFIKGSEHDFYSDEIRVKSIYTDGDKRLNPRGSIPHNVFKVNRVHNYHPWRESGHPALFPCEIIERLVLSSTKENDFVLDPFAGIGTVGAVCSWNKRKFIGFEISKKYVDFGNKIIGEPRPIWANWDWLKRKTYDIEEGW